MKQKTIIILGLALMFIVSCQNDIVPDIYPGAESDEIPVKVSLSMKPGIFHDTDYEPMTRAEGEDLPRVQISNVFNVLISKKVGNRWILEKNLTNKFDATDTYNTKPVRVMNDQLFHSFETDLRPGTYRMTVITGSSSLNWETYLVPGLVVEDEEGNIHPACTYRIVEDGYLNPGTKHIQEEIFSGCEPFDVIKTEDVHTPSPNQNVHIQLDRRVTKLRIFLKYEETSNGNNFFATHNNGIIADLQLKPNAKPFPNGLDVWGNVYFDPDDVLENMKFSAFTWIQPQVAKNGQLYMLPMKNFTRQYSVFYFTEPSQEIPVTLSGVEVSASTQIGINYVYALPEAERGYDTGSPIDIVLKHNTQYGIVFKPGSQSWSDPRGNQGGQTLRNMILDVDGSNNPVDHSDLFPYAYEYDLTPRP